MKQTIQITIEFQVEHKPGNSEHLEQVVKKYLQSKGVEYTNGIIKI